MRDSVCIVGTGALTSVGLTAPATAAAVRAGIANFNEHPYMIDQEADPYVLAMVPTLDADLIGVERYLQLAGPAIEEALGPLAAIGKSLGEIYVLIGIPEERPGLPHDLAVSITRRVNEIKFENFGVADSVVLPKGHSSGLMALGAAAREISRHTCEFCLIGGVDSYIDPDTLDWLEDNDQIHKPLNAWGFIPGEAASFCLVCSQETAQRYDMPVLARLSAISVEIEANRIKTETVCVGKGLTKAVRNCLEQQPSGCRIDYTICDQNGEAYRADEFGFMIARLSKHFVDASDYMTPADCWGDVGAASGPLFINLVAYAAEKGYAKGLNTLLWTSSEGGERAAAIIEADVIERGAAWR